MLTNNYVDIFQHFKKAYTNTYLGSIVGRFDAKQQLPKVLPKKHASAPRATSHLDV